MHSWRILWLGLFWQNCSSQQWYTVHTWPEQSVLCTSWETNLTAWDFLKTYVTYAFMANFMAWFGGERSVDSMWNRADYIITASEWWRDQKSMFNLLHERMNKLCDTFWRLMTLMHSWLFRVSMLAKCLHTEITEDAFHNWFSVEALCRQKKRGLSVLPNLGHK